MITHIKTLALGGISFLTPVCSLAEVGGILEAGYTIYDNSDVDSYGGQFGLSHLADNGAHYLLVSFFEMNKEATHGGGLGGLGPAQNQDIDLTGFGLNYRYGLSFFEDFEPYLEYGWKNISKTFNTMDILGNPKQLEVNNYSDHLAVGVMYRVWENLNLNAKISYQGVFSDLIIGTPSSDILGNSILLYDDLNISASISVSIKF